MPAIPKKSAHSLSNIKNAIFDRRLKTIQKDFAAQYKGGSAFRSYYDLPLIQMVTRLQGIKKNFKNIAFIGPNPYFFLQNMPFSDVEKFTFIEQSSKSVEKSYEIINNIINQEILPCEKQPDEIVPKIMCDETSWVENFGSDEQFDLIISNMNLHWNNNIEQTLLNYKNSLVPDGVFISASLGGDTLQEMRICMNLAE